MWKSILAFSAVLTLSSAQGAPFPAPPLYPSFTAPQSGSLPLLKGAYVFTLRRFCQPELTVTYNKSGIVDSIALAASSDQFEEGTLTFVQGSTAGSGTVTIAAINDSGSAFLVENSGASSGTSGTPLAQKTESGSNPFKQTATTFAIKDTSGTSTYNVYYGAVAGGIAQHAVFGGLDDKGCAEQGMMTIQ